MEGVEVNDVCCGIVSSAMKPRALGNWAGTAMGDGLSSR